MSNSNLNELISMLSSPENTANGTVTRSVRVPDSEHVAQIVGRAGIKIKLLRQKTNTTIRTPLRSDAPIFVVTGAPADVDKAVEALRLSSDHFSKLSAQKSTHCAIGEISISVPVPRRFVGTVVGRGGGIIVKIKNDTNTRINSPKSDEPGEGSPEFIVTGRYSDVLTAKKTIEERIALAVKQEERRKASFIVPQLYDNSFQIWNSQTADNHNSYLKTELNFNFK